MKITYLGLGKMGLNMTTRLIKKGHTVFAFDPDEVARKNAEKAGAIVSSTIKGLFEKTQSPRTIWIMVPHTVVENVLNELLPFLNADDTIIEGSNSPFKETMKRAKKIEKLHSNFLDAGVSGGPGGAKNGACIMVGGKKEIYKKYEPLFKDLTVPNGYAHVGESGAGHFVKMVHNGIEYGMMQALAEGFDIIKNAHFSSPLALRDIAKLYNHGSVIESKLVGWLHSGFEKYGENLNTITGSVSSSGEGLWTVETAHELDIHIPIIEHSLKVRTKSQTKPSYQGQILSVMRNQFGGHDAEKK
jgi:6-phosphogluconate dehydrogenase